MIGEPGDRRAKYLSLNRKPLSERETRHIMKMNWRLFRRLAAAIFAGGIRGISVGCSAGAVVGVFFYVIGSVFGAAIAAPFGFIAGLIGMAIGGRLGWAIGGAASLVVPIAIYGIVGNLTIQDIAYLTIAAAIALIYGGGIGLWYGGRVEEPYLSTDAWFATKQPVDSMALYRRDVDYVALYDIPLRWRLLAALTVLVLTVGTIYDMVQLFIAVVSLIGK